MIYKDYFNGDYILSLPDKNGEMPEIVVICSHDRGPGKTTYMSGYLLNNYIKNNRQFVLLTRTKQKLGRVASGVLNSFINVFHPGYSIVEHVVTTAYSEICLRRRSDDDQSKYEEEICGYVVAINGASDIKECSSEFANVDNIFFDEFMPKTKESYLSNEVEKVKDIFDSIARGPSSEPGKHIRPCRLILCSNTITLGNPYFTELQLNSKIQKDTKVYRGDGIVFERVEVEGLAEEHATRPFHRAFGDDKKPSNIWINDDGALVAKPLSWGQGMYIATLTYFDKCFGLLHYPASGFFYISRSYDKFAKNIIPLTIGPKINKAITVLNPIMKEIRDNFFLGLVRVNDQELQELLYKLYY